MRRDGTGGSSPCTEEAFNARDTRVKGVIMGYYRTGNICEVSLKISMRPRGTILKSASGSEAKSTSGPDIGNGRKWGRRVFWHG